MIKVDKEMVRVSGHRLIVKAEFSYLVHSLISEEIFDKDEIMKLVATGCMTDKEREEEVMKFKESIEKLAEDKKDDSGEGDDFDAFDEAIKDIIAKLKKEIM